MASPLQSSHHAFVKKDLKSVWTNAHLGRRDALVVDMTQKTSLIQPTFDAVRLVSVENPPISLFPLEAINSMFAQAPSTPQLKKFKTAVMSRDPSGLVSHLFWFIFLLLFQKNSCAEAAVTECRRRFAAIYAEKFILLDAGEFSSKLGLFLSETVVILFEKTFDTTVNNPFDNFMVEQIYYIVNKELFGLALASTTITHFRQSFFRARFRATMANTFVHRHFVSEAPTLTTVHTSPVISLLSHRTKVFTKDDPGWTLRAPHFVRKPQNKTPMKTDLKSSHHESSSPINTKVSILSNTTKDIDKFIQITQAPLLADAAFIDAHYSGRPRLLMPLNNF